MTTPSISTGAVAYQLASLANAPFAGDSRTDDAQAGQPAMKEQ